MYPKKSSKIMQNLLQSFVFKTSQLWGLWGVSFSLENLWVKWDVWVFERRSREQRFVWAPYCVAKLTSMTLIDLQLRWRQIRRLIVFVETPQSSLESLFTLLYGTITFLTCQSIYITFVWSFTRSSLWNITEREKQFLDGQNSRNFSERH